MELITDRESSMSKGFAFVNITAQTDADKAISMYNTYVLTGNELKVNIAKSRISKK